MVAPECEYVGVMMPNCTAASLATVGILMADKVPAVLNFTASREALRSAVSKASLTHILTSRKFLAKLKMEPMREMVFLEDIAAGVTRSDDCDTQGDAALTQSVYEVLGQYTCRRSLGTLAGPSDSHLQEGVIRSIDILFAEETEGGTVQRSVVVYDDGTLLLDRTVYRLSASDANALMDDLLSVCTLQSQ